MTAAMTDPRELGRRVRDTRHALGWTQKELARNAKGMSTTTVVHVERGRSFPKFETAVRIADALDVSLDWLAGRTEVRADRLAIETERLRQAVDLLVPDGERYVVLLDDGGVFCTDDLMDDDVVLVDRAPRAGRTETKK